MNEGRKSLTYEDIKSERPLKQGSSLSMEGENYIVALDRERVFSLTPGAYYVWMKCNGEKTVEDLINDMSKELSENPGTAMSIDELKTPVTVIINQLIDAGLLTFK